MKRAGILLAALLGSLAGPAAADRPLWTELPAGRSAAVSGCQDFSALIERVRPAVVAVQTLGTRSQQEQPFPLLPEWPGRPRLGVGSGFIIRADGLVVTNHHVVDGASSIEILLQDHNRPIKAELLGSDDDYDIALLRFEPPHQLPVLPLGNSTDLSIGGWVVAIGNPLGITAVATKGIVSGKGRSLQDLPSSLRGGSFDFIQTDAAIDMGSSGGPLLNLAGEVVGVNTAINARARGIGFAVPIDLVKAVLPQLAAHGEVKKSYVGISVGALGWEQAKAAGLEEARGVVVTRVVDESPAGEGGLLVDDIILAIGGARIDGLSDVGWRIATSPAGEPLELVVYREKARLSLKITPRERAKK